MIKLLKDLKKVIKELWDQNKLLSIPVMLLILILLPFIIITRIGLHFINRNKNINKD